MTDETAPREAVVPIKSLWVSKVNWAAVVTVVSLTLSIFNVNLPPDIQEKIPQLITALTSVVALGGAIATWALNAFARKSVPATSVSSDAPVIVPGHLATAGAQGLLSSASNIIVDLRQRPFR